MFGPNTSKYCSHIFVVNVHANGFLLSHPACHNIANGITVSKVQRLGMNRYNQVSHLTQDTNVRVTNSQLDNTNESQEVSLFSVGDHKAHINRHT